MLWNKKKIGTNDSSVSTVSEDLFQVQKYVDGLTAYIKNCVTPMTISIQGDWGSGKTSMMNMIKDKLGDDVITVWFNTWQYSQFSMGDDLAISFLGKLIQSLQLEKSGEAAKALKKACGALKKVSLITVDHFVGGAAASEIESLMDKYSQTEDDAVDAINSLKEQFEKSVAKRLEELKKDRLVVFIDDLDRLHPGKAVELLEILKIFLDCEQCVFVLAIDYAVVSQGVKDKYGDLIGEDKGKSFFDKIIQVPFKMPVAHYKVDNFLINMFKQVDIDLEKDGRANVYVELIQKSVGCNPRTMKRLFNAYLLLTHISMSVLDTGLENIEDDSWKKQMMFGILCCQHAFEDLYDFLVRNYNDFDGSKLFKAMCSSSAYRMTENELEDDAKIDNEILVDAFGDKSEDEIRRMAAFMEIFVKIIDKDGDASLDQDEIRCFGEILNLSTITSARDTVESGSYSESEWRVHSRKIMQLVMDDVYPVIQQANANNDIDHPVYQTKKDLPDFKFTWADVWAYVEIADNGAVAFENVLMVDSEGKLALKTYIKRRRSFAKQDYVDYFKNHQKMLDYGFTWQHDPEGLCIVTNDLGMITADATEQKNIANMVSKLIKERFELLS